MKIKKSNKLSALLVLSFFIYPIIFSAVAEECFTNLNTTNRDVLEKSLVHCRENIEQEEYKLQDKQHLRTQTEYNIALINVEINKSLLQIRTSDLTIQQLRQDINAREQKVKEIEAEIKEYKFLLSKLLKKINEDELRGLVDLIFAETRLSSFFLKNNEYLQIQESIEGSIKNITRLRDRLDASFSILNKKKEETEEVRQQQKAAAVVVQQQKNEKQKILNIQLNEEKKIIDNIASFEQRAAQIQNRLFDLRGGGAIPFNQALDFAKLAERLTGIRPAYLLGVIKHESDLGKNVGKGSYLIDMHPTRDRPIFPYITRLLGYKPEELRISANPGFGWGGAMGPAQFIPSTWVCYGGFINTKTNTCNKSVNIITTKANLAIGSSGTDVYRLQKFLNENGFTIAKEGPTSKGKETRLYTKNVANAVKRFQEKYHSRILKQYGYTKGTGTVGPSTRNAINELNFYKGPWRYVSSKDKIRKLTKSDSPTNPWNPRDAFITSAVYLTELGATKDECTASRRYYAGGNWRSAVALNYCRAVLSNAKLFAQDINYLNN